MKLKQQFLSIHFDSSRRPGGGGLTSYSFLELLYLILPYALSFYWFYWHFVLGPCILFSPECVARVPVSLRGSGDWGCVRSTLHLRSQPSTVVRNRPREGHMAVPMVSSAEGIAFGGFKRLVASFCAAGVALRDVQTFFVTRPKSFCVASAILLRRFQKMRCSFRGRRSTLDVYIVILHGRRSTLDVLCRVFLRTAMSGLRQAATKCRFRGRRGVLWDVMKIDGSLAQFWGCKFSEENIGFEATKCQNWMKSRTKCSFWCSHVSRLESLVFLWPRRLYGGSCKTFPFRRFPSRSSCRFAWQAQRFVTFQPVW